MNEILTIKRIYFFILLAFTQIGFCQVETNYVTAFQTDPNYSETEDSSAISKNLNSTTGQLFLFLGGTGSSSSTSYNVIRLYAANLGFDFINLNYPNSVPAASLAESNDILAFDKYRQEICFGTPNSESVSVDSLNSIYTRTLKLLQYLEQTNPTENWSQYLINSNSIDWSKIIIGGHSQGAGHAAYLAKQFLINRVLMFSGPNDYSEHFLDAANWLKQTGATPISRHFAYLSLNDEIVDFSSQFVNLTELGVLEEGDSIHVDNTTPPYENSHVLYTTQPPGLAITNHSSPMKFSSINNDVWSYMLTSEILTSLESNQEDHNVSIYPNPVTSLLHLNLNNQLINKTYNLLNVAGKTIKSGKTKQVNPLSIDISELNNGIYFLVIDNQSFKLIKQ